MLTAAEEIELIKLLEIEQKEREVKQNTRNEIYSIVERFKGRYVVLIGGSGSGKSYEIADRILDRMKNEPKTRILCVRAQRNQVSESQFPLLKSRSTQEYRSGFGKKESRGDEEINHTNGAQTIFSGLDDVEKLKSIFDITSVWIEEADQVEEKDVQELDRRLRGYKEGVMQIYLTFNPVSVLSYLKKRFFDNRIAEYKIKDGETIKTARLNRTITLRGETPFENFTYYKDFNVSDAELNKKILVWSDEKKAYTEEYYYNTLIIHSTYRDNKFIDDDYYKVMQDLKESDIDEYNIYSLGQWGITGGTYFNKGNVNKRIQDNPLPIKTGYFDYEYVNEKIVDSSIKWIDDPQGYIEIFEDVQKGYPYVAGGDTAGEGSDWNIGYFTNNVTKEDAALLRVNFDEDLYARQMYCLGKYYNTALIGIETKFSTHPVKELIRLGYHNQYIREERPDAYTGKTKKIYGFDTNTATRPTALGMLRTEVREHPERIKSMQCLYEMTTFVKNEKGKPEATKGAHDDIVMARAINCYISHQQTTRIKVEKVETYPINSLEYKVEKNLQRLIKARKRGRSEFV
jgi:phage terminase large subunit